MSTDLNPRGKQLHKADIGNEHAAEYIAVSFEDWLNSVSEQKQDRVLGSHNAQKFRDGKLNLRSLVANKPLSKEEVAKIDAAFPPETGYEDRTKMNRALRDILIESSEDELREALVDTDEDIDALAARGRAAAQRALSETSDSAGVEDLQRAAESIGDVPPHPLIDGPIRVLGHLFLDSDHPQLQHCKFCGQLRKLGDAAVGTCPEIPFPDKRARELAELEPIARANLEARKEGGGESDDDPDDSVQIMAGARKHAETVIDEHAAKHGGWLGTCESCRFWSELSVQGQCRVRAPALPSESIPSDMAVLAVWPMTGSADFCGEWEAKP